MRSLEWGPIRYDVWAYKKNEFGHTETSEMHMDR